MLSMKLWARDDESGRRCSVDEWWKWEVERRLSQSVLTVCGRYPKGQKHSSPQVDDEHMSRDSRLDSDQINPLILDTHDPVPDLIFSLAGRPVRPAPFHQSEGPLHADKQGPHEIVSCCNLDMPSVVLPIGLYHHDSTTVSFESSTDTRPPQVNGPV